ncbi:histamine H2 receptor-like isoform X1 [Acanthaster planci]|uniref:Histamine H2 receptor-like isoform X1 n=1 Tax=Acanthaster planci TaxID=133434 RepID=A0A8B7YTG8_ACAPL|nr:histamine H2 receptor-like isoform X1 [Acanthaster planci]XP_022095772.1 histamine H2 receptor-like isoform X1 [Acanthaster planci]XP_022095773.1 histamine H2 receptor-like isoform X1 [Acanthaster planci]XP_022095774.1 histamine H2 receptor-like isoform X1 [Acanthaster planci]XP_022095775.1 histamine H2 receptor-like isoform X1 [Acanthaster planci]
MSQADTETVFIMAVTESAATDATVIPNISDSLTWDSASTNNLTTPAPGLQPPYWDLPVVITLASVLSIVMVISIIGNSLIILTIIFFKGMRSKTNMFITNLACADLGVSVLCMPFSLATVIQGDWTFGPVLCNANAFFEALFLVASTHGLMAIALHKFSSLVLPLKRIINLRRAIAMVTFAWFIGLTCAIGPLVGLTKNVYKPGTSQCGPKYPEKLSEKIIGLYVPLVGIIIPLTCLILVYGVIFNTIRKYSRRLRSHTSMTEDKIFHQQKRITITLFIVFVAFFICWTPYFVYSTLGFSLGFQKVPTILNVAAYWSGYTNSALNPIIYAWRAKSYRKAFRKIFCCNVKGSLLSDTGTANNGDSSSVALRLSRARPSILTPELVCRKSSCYQQVWGQQGVMSAQSKKGEKGSPSPCVEVHEFASPALLRRSRILQGGYPGSQPGSKSSSLNSILKPSPVPRRDHGSSTNRPTAILVKDVKTNHGDIWLRGLVGVNGHTGLQGTSSDDDEDDVFLPDRALRRSQSETDKEWLERKHFEVTPRAKNHFPYRSDPGKRGLKKSLSIGLKQQEPPTQQIPNINWEPDAKARRALLGRSTIV